MVALRWLAALLCLLAAGAAEAATCGGRDLIAGMRREDTAGFAALEAEAAAIPFGQGLLFEVTRPGVAPSYLFGTVHLHDPRSAALPAPLVEAVARAEAVVLELAEVDALTDPKTLERLGPALLKYVLAKADERASRLLPPESLARLEEAMPAYGLPANAAQVFKPGFLALLLSIPSCAVPRGAGAPPGVDAAIARLAAEKGVPVKGLETLEEQLAVLTMLPAERQRDALAAALKGLPQAEDVLETTLARYRAGETGLLWVALRRNADALGVRAAFDDTMSRLLDERNLVMRRRALPFLERGGAVIAVGALHLPGEQGLARLFEQSGYHLRLIEDVRR